MPKCECFLRSIEGLHPDISLPDGEKVVLGRGRATKVKEARCSRVQLCLTADLANATVRCAQMGGNPSRVAGSLLKVGEKIQISHKDKIELLAGQFFYSVIFNPPPSPPTGSEGQGKKRQLSEEKSTSPSSPTPKPTVSKKPRFDTAPALPWYTPDTAPALPWYTPEKGHVFSSQDGMAWRRVYDGKVLELRRPDCQDRTKIAAFDLDGTIITTQSGKVFAVDKNDWKILYPEVPGKLKSLHNDGFKIVFITNQAGISRGKLKEEDFREKAERIVKKLGVPVQLVASTAQDGFFRKPRPGIWFWIQGPGNAEMEIDREVSFYCGDAAGREPNWEGKRKKDFSCSDRLFAANIGIAFHTPEEFFLGHKPTKKFVLPGFNPQEQVDLKLLIPDSEPFTENKQEMIMLVGIQGSGKSHIALELEKAGYLVASNDRSGGKEKTLRTVRDGLNQGRKIVVDNTHRDVESRKDYLQLAQQSQVPVRCFLMNTSHDQARHNNVYRELTDKSHTKIKEMLFNSYRSRFEEPTLSEGFSSIARVNFVPTFPDDAHRQLYQMHLLEK